MTQQWIIWKKKKLPQVTLVSAWAPTWHCSIVISSSSTVLRGNPLLLPVSHTDTSQTGSVRTFSWKVLPVELVAGRVHVYYKQYTKLNLFWSLALYVNEFFFQGISECMSNHSTVPSLKQHSCCCEELRCLLSWCSIYAQSLHTSVMHLHTI